MGVRWRLEGRDRSYQGEGVAGKEVGMEEQEHLGFSSWLLARVREEGPEEWGCCAVMKLDGEGRDLLGKNSSHITVSCGEAEVVWSGCRKGSTVSMGYGSHLHRGDH